MSSSSSTQVEGSTKPGVGGAAPPAADDVALYLRVSTDDQDLAGQERELRAYAARRGWLVTRVYPEKISATGRVERTEYERLISDAHARETRCDHVLVWALDRWSREPSFVRAIGSIEELEALGVQFHSYREPMLDSGDGPNLARDLLRGILPTIAAFESRRRSERTRLAMREIKEGLRIPRGPVGRPRKVTPELEARIRQLRGERLKWREIAVRVHLPAGTCRKVGGGPVRGKPGVGNGRAGFGTPREVPQGHPPPQ